MAETFDKNMIDKDEYPRTAEIEMRCVNILSHLWNSPDHEEATGTSTTGSSEAAMLGGMALKWRWRDRMRAQGKPTDKPNMVMGSNVQVCWEKFCRYWDVEPRLVPMEGRRFHMNAEEAVKHCDENTIGVIPVLGSTFDGSYEPVADICAALDKLPQDQREALILVGASGFSYEDAAAICGCAAGQALLATSAARLQAAVCEDPTHLAADALAMRYECPTCCPKKGEPR